MLFRPFILSDPGSRAMDATRRNEATQKTRSAAVKMNSFLEQILDHDLVEYLSPSMISPLILAMQIHLLDCKSTVRSTSRLGHHRLQLCMIVQAELKDTYWGADSAFKLFEQAQAKLLKITARRELESRPSTGASGEVPGIALPQSVRTSISNEPAEITPSVDDLLTFDLAFTEPQDFQSFDDFYM